MEKVKGLKRDIAVMVKLNEVEYKFIERAVKMSGMSLSEWFRTMAREKAATVLRQPQPVAGHG